MKKAFSILIATVAAFTLMTVSAFANEEPVELDSGLVIEEISPDSFGSVLASTPDDGTPLLGASGFTYIDDFGVIALDVGYTSKAPSISMRGMIKTDGITSTKI